MESLLKDVEPRMQKVLLQLKNEITIFERLMYKNANQHRRALYFRRLCQVRRDLRLLQSAHLADLIQNIAQCFGNTSREPSLQKGRWQSKHTNSEVQDLKRCLYGVARLTEQMSDPILNASSQVAGLLGQTFFMPFALTTFSILARLRVLVLQCLHEIVDTFNLFSAWALEKGHFDHKSHDLPASLECKWDGTKLSLADTFTNHQQNMENEGFVLDCNGRKYTVFGSLVSGDMALEHEGAEATMPSPHLISKASNENMLSSNLMTPSVEKTDVCNSVEQPDVLIQEINEKNKAKDLSTWTASIPVSKKNVAYVTVHSTFGSQTEKMEEEMHPPKRQKKDSLFDMLLGLGDETHKNLF